MQSIVFKLHPSKVYCVLLALVLVASAGIALNLPIHLLLKSALLLVLAGYGAHIFYRYAWLQANLSIVAVNKLDGDRWQVTTSMGVVDAQLRGDSTLTAIVSILRFDFPQKRWPVVSIICRDSLAPEQYRQLVGVLRVG
jgi:hypothetical protein